MQEELDSIKRMVEENQAALAALTKKVESIRRRMYWAALYGTFKFLIIVVPLVLSIWYFHPQLSQLYESWLSLSRNIQQFNQGAGGQDARQLDAGILEDLLKRY